MSEAFDFSAAVSAAQEAVNRSENSGDGNYKYPLVYPSPNSTLTIRPLFNPASGQIVRLVNRHDKVACYKTYGIECPICKVQQQVKDMTGQDPFGRKSASKPRGICFAQFVESSVPYDKGGNRGNIQPGEIVLFMFPWSVYNQISSAIQTTAASPTGMDLAFCHADSGFYLKIQVSPDYKYTVTQDPYRAFPSGKTDDEFMTMLEGMESLYEQVLPSTITEEVDKQVKEYADTIYRDYIAPRVANQGVPAGTAPVNFSQGAPAQTTPVQQPVYQQPPVNNTIPQAVPGAPTINNATAPVAPPIAQPPVADTPPWQATPQPIAPATPASAPSAGGFPACFGNHQDGSPQCITCPSEMMCMQPTGEGSPV